VTGDPDSGSTGSTNSDLPKDHGNFVVFGDSSLIDPEAFSVISSDSGTVFEEAAIDSGPAAPGPINSRQILIGLKSMTEEDDKKYHFFLKASYEKLGIILGNLDKLQIESYVRP